MKVVVAPDKFAGTLSAAEAAEAMAAGWARARPGDDVVVVPMADGGEGTLEVVEAAVAGCRRVTVEVADPRGRAVAADWLRLPDGRGLVEAAQACGLWRLQPQERNPRQATSYGVGQLLAAAVDAGCSEVVVGLGGSATVDGGAGLAIALGHRLLRTDGNGVRVGGQYLRQLARIVPAPAPAARVVAAVDVTNPLLGPDGAVATFAPQKGAAPEDLPVLEQALATLADVAERYLPDGPWRDLPGAGAAGGLGFALAGFCRARLTGGAEAVAELVGLGAALDGAAVALTGEGALDAQTRRGKVPAFVGERGRAVGAVVGAVAGRVADGAQQGFDAVAALGPEGPRRARELVVERTAELARRIGQEADG
ncbi:MAG TPA: glycerate kinase [Egibacteraceae bacterium]|nr:glycerate kinase [Egibacteraceae bacterium]